MKSAPVVPFPERQGSFLKLLDTLQIGEDVLYYVQVRDRILLFIGNKSGTTMISETLIQTDAKNAVSPNESSPKSARQFKASASESATPDKSFYSAEVVQQAQSSDVSKHLAFLTKPSPDAPADNKNRSASDVKAASMRNYNSNNSSALRQEAITVPSHPRNNYNPHSDAIKPSTPQDWEAVASMLSDEDATEQRYNDHQAPKDQQFSSHTISSAERPRLGQTFRTNEFQLRQPQRLAPVQQSMQQESYAYEDREPEIMLPPSRTLNGLSRKISIVED